MAGVKQERVKSPLNYPSSPLPWEKEGEFGKL